jgi:uncharacterized protein YraI
MMIKRIVCVVVLGLSLVVMIGAAPTAAQAGPDAYTYVLLNMRSGPGEGCAVITVLDLDTPLILEARNADVSWVLGHSEDGTRRGWVYAIYLRYREGFSAARLPVSDEVIAAAAPASVGGESAAPVSSGPAPAGLARAQEIFRQGQAMGNTPGAFIKVGDCNADSDEYLKAAFLTGQYDLGAYGYLQSTIDFFGGSFGHFNASANPGFSILAVMDPMYRKQEYCHEWISSLDCAFQYMHPSVVFVMPMAGDVYGLTDYQYASGLRAVVDYAIAHGAIPVLVTFPVSTREGAINGTLRGVAGEYGLPLVDFASAARALPDRGLVPGDTVHLSGVDFISFNGDQDRYGFTLLNLMSLQMLDQLRGVMN